jgi:hypothetical protein
LEVGRTTAMLAARTKDALPYQPVGMYIEPVSAGNDLEFS